jgi:DNA-binding LacI/PurR family transcriptional regulator
MKRETLREHVEPLFARALRDRDITAWVISNDLTALSALGFLRSRRRRVPQEISVLGFDDIYEAFSAKMTSYSFNLPALMHAMLSYVLRPSSFRGKATHDSPFEVEGFVSQRGSSGRVPMSRMP